MLRPLLALLALSLAAIVLAPTVESVHEHVASLDIHREMPWRIWKWDDEPQPPDFMPPDCDPRPHPLFSEVTGWPKRIPKNQSFDISGKVVEQGTNVGVGTIEVDLFLNETKEAPGTPLGRATTDASGAFRLPTSVPFDLGAQRYHIVAHALYKQIGCKKYLEHWSDPEMEVTSRTHVDVELPEKVVVGRDLVVRGLVKDDVGAPVRNHAVNVTIDGKTQSLKTDAGGRFEAMQRIGHVGNATVTVDFPSTKYYAASSRTERVPILPEDLELDGVSPSDPLAIVRGQPATITGRVYLAPDVKPGALTLVFDKPIVACEGCAPALNATVPTDAQGNFTLNLVAPSSEPGGAFNMTLRGGGLKQSYRYEGVVYVPVTVAVDGRGNGLFGRSFNATARATDETGASVPGDVGLMAASGWLAGNQTKPGEFSYQSDASCGVHRLTARYNGTAEYMSAQKEIDVGVCGFLAFIPPWLLGVPWWVWPLSAVGLLAAYRLGRVWIVRRANTLSRGPALTLAIAQPDDAAPDVMGVGETILVTAQLEEPLLQGLSLRIGMVGALAPADPGPDLRASFAFAAERLGQEAIRAEIVDARGRPLTRRTVEVRIVHYAEEIERRYRALRKSRIGADEAVSPREFEAWLRSRADHLDPAVARRLVDVFEESDYGPREASRREFLAYFEAERGVEEVKVPAA